MLIEGYKKSRKSVSIQAESENIMEFIHIRDSNRKYIGIISILNNSDGTAKLKFDTEV